MKRILLALLCAACMTTIEAKTIVAFFSATGTTKAAAERLAKQHNARLWEIEPAEPYTAADLDWRNDKSRSSIEMSDPEERLVGYLSANHQLVARQQPAATGRQNDDSFCHQR